MKVDIEIGGKVRPILFSVNAQADIEDLLGRSIAYIDFSSAKTFRAIAYSGLKWGLYNSIDGKEPKPDFTLLQVGDWLHEVGMTGEVNASILKAFTESLPKPKKDEAGESPANQSQ